tara:strand:+ start:137 stop:919 length:783 start_codon:yes stop_codon:yes gene_type:complete
MNNETKLLAIHPACVPKAQAMLTATELPKLSLDEDDEKEFDYYADSRLAIIPINGVLGHKLSAAQKAMGGVDTVDIMQAVETAAIDDDVEMIVLDVDSPGGTVGGIPELAETIEEVQREGKKQIIAYTDSMIASAAYWAVAGANAIYASQSSEVGSIGVYMPIIDSSLNLKEQGVTVELIKAGKFKGAGFPGVAIDEDVRSFLQAEVNETYDDFTAYVNKFRPSLGTDKMQGQTFSGKRAAQIGMIDGMKKNLKSLLETL